MIPDRDMSMSLGQFVKEKRELLGLSQRALAKKAGVSPAAINRLEAGETQPETATIEAIASALRIPLSQMLDIVQGRRGMDGKDSLINMIEALPKNKRLLVEGVVKLILEYEES